MTLLLSHDNTNELFDLSTHQIRLKNTPALALPLHEELLLLEELSEFELGQFLLKNKGLNGYWTAYIILHGKNKATLHPLEHWLLHRAPGIKAPQERFQIFQKQLQAHVLNNGVMASIPCGLMDDLLQLDYSNHTNISLIGIDLDEESLRLATHNANKYGVTPSFTKRDAWDLRIQEQFNLITSNGLNIYEPDDNKVTQLYRQFFKALKSNGVLITSFVTPPPVLSSNSPWRDYNIDDAIKQKAIFNDILQVNWQSYRTEEKTCEQLEDAGFKVQQIIYDSQSMFPTVVAKKL